jgi:AAA+ superfamily predicted ATPase
MQQTADFLQAELQWLRDCMKFRYAQHFKAQATEFAQFSDIPKPDPAAFDCPYTQLLIEYAFGPLERFTLIFALAPHLDPSLTEVLNVTHSDTNMAISEFGAIKGTNSSLLLPSGQTVAFFFFGTEIASKVQVLNLFEADHPLTSLQLVELGPAGPGEPSLFGVLMAKPELLDLIWVGKSRTPRFGNNFPARLITTNLDWEDLVLDNRVFRQLEEILTWLRYGHVLMNEWGMKRIVKPGYRALFYGPPGTGKTLCATLLGKLAGLEVFRIDLSMIVSKYIGETEKNIAKVFDVAERKNWILFFDEADALFGKRTSVQDSHDRYANQEVSYLLQRVEEYDGLVLLATNLRSNLDEAFTRRFQTIVNFPMPRQEERIQLWRQSIPAAARLDADLDLNSIAMQYEFSGGAIVNAIQYASLQTIKEGNNSISKRLLIEAIKREFHKEGKTI